MRCVSVMSLPFFFNYWKSWAKKESLPHPHRLEFKSIRVEKEKERHKYQPNFHISWLFNLILYFILIMNHRRHGARWLAGSHRNWHPDIRPICGLSLMILKEWLLCVRACVCICVCAHVRSHIRACLGLGHAVAWNPPLRLIKWKSRIINCQLSLDWDAAAGLGKMSSGM